MARTWIRFLVILAVVSITLHNPGAHAVIPTDGADPPFPPPAVPQAN